MSPRVRVAARRTARSESENVSKAQQQPAYTDRRQPVRARPWAALRPISVIVAALLLTNLVACTSAQRPVAAEYDNPAEYAYDLAEYRFERKDFDYARALFQGVQQDHPYSLYATLAELRVADTHFRERSYLASAAAYRRFIQLHPRHERVSYAAYKVVHSYGKMMPRGNFLLPATWERDRIDAERARRAAQSFMENYSTTEYADEVQEILVDASDRLAAYELYAAEFYMDRRHRQPIATVRRTQTLLDLYPESSLIPEALALQVEAALAEGEHEIAETANTRLQGEFAGTEHAQRAAELVAAHSVTVSEPEN